MSDKARSLDTFINEAMTEKQTTKQEELELSKKIAKGDLKARETLVKRNMRFAWHMAKQYDGNGVDLCSLVQEAAIALWIASERFDGGRGMKFTSWSAWFIRNAMNRIIADISHAVTFPRFNCSHPLARREVEELTDKLGRLPTNKEFEKETGRAGNICGIIQDLYKWPVRLDDPIDHGDPDSDTFQSIFVCEGEQTDRAADCSSNKDFVKVLLPNVDERERYILTEFFGFNDQKPRTLTSLGAELGISRERTRQIKLKALEKLRAAAHVDGLKRKRGLIPKVA